jgi:hypothetical protein
MAGLNKASNTKTILKYHDIKATLYRARSLSDAAVSNVLSYEELVPKGVISNAPTVGYPIDVSRILYTSDASPSTLTATMPDYTYATYNNPKKDGWGKDLSNSSGDTNNPPKAGDGIVVHLFCDANSSTIYDETAKPPTKTGYKCIFRGYVGGVSRQISESGISYSIEAKDMKSRLQDQVIKKTYNGSYKKDTMPTSIDGAISGITGPYVNEKMTVDQILQDILNYANKSSFTKVDGSDVFIRFSYSDFDFNGLDALQNFIPPTLSFDNITILEAIYRLISSAGPYRIVYDPENDKIYFTRLSSDCKKNGPEIFLRYVNSSSENKDYSEVNVISDTTSRKTNDVASILKAYSSTIDWYSGHFYIEMGKDTNSVDGTEKTGTGAGDSAKLRLSCKNWDGYNYFFGINSIPYGESITTQYEVVGCPLYPAWDPTVGYDAYTEKYKGYFKKHATESTYTGIPGNIELRTGMTVNDRKYISHSNFTDTVGKNTYYNATGFSYEAWVPYGICEACAGSGAVADYTTYFNGFGKTRDAMGNKTLLYPIVTPFDYAYESESNSSDNSNSNQEEDMSPYVGTGEMVPTKHPVPWKNTCPVCRGTGMEPWYRMTTLLTTLIDLTPEQTKIGELTAQNAANTNSGTIQKDKTWADVVSDMSYRYPICVQVETSTLYPSYKYEDKSKYGTISHSLVNTMQTSLTPSTPFNASLVFKTSSDPSGMAIKESDGYLSRLYYTQISSANGYSIDAERGMIIFKNAQYITCNKPIKNLNIHTEKSSAFDNKVVSLPCTTMDSNISYASKGDMNGVGNKVMGFWRPAKAWITCYFKRDKFQTKMDDYTSGDLVSEFSNSKEYDVERKITGDNNSEETSTYRASTKIEDNRYCIEMFKKSAGEVEEFKVRPIIKGISMDDLKWQLHPWDFGKWNIPIGTTVKLEVPTSYDNLWNEIYAETKTASYLFPCGKFHSIEPLRDSEARSLFSDADQAKTALRSDRCGKIIAWIHKDERIKLLERATAELERRNDIQMAGSVTIRGEIPNFVSSNLSTEGKGLGFVTLYDGTKANVVQIEMGFSGGITMSMEVGTEELRIGMKKEEEKDYNRRLENKITELNLKSQESARQSIYSADGAGSKTINIGAASVRIGR